METQEENQAAAAPNLPKSAVAGVSSTAAAPSASAAGDRDLIKPELMPAPRLKRPREVEDWLLHPPDGSEPIDLRREAEAIYSAFELSLCRDVVFELHRELHTGVLTNERLWAERLNPPPKPAPGGDVYGRTPPREPSSSITCPSCNRAVGAARYAPHLDKCALGSSRGRASRSARSQAAQDASKSMDSSSPSSRQSSSKPSSKLLPSPKPKPKPPKLVPSPKPPKSSAGAAGAASARSPPQRPPSKPPSLSRAPLAPRPAPPPPPPAVHAALVDSGRDPLHILIKLVDGAPVQTYHRVVLSTPRVDKDKPQSQQARSPSTRSVGSDDRPGGGGGGGGGGAPREPSTRGAAVGGNSGGGGGSGGSRGSGSGGGASAVPGGSIGIPGENAAGSSFSGPAPAIATAAAAAGRAGSAVALRNSTRQKQQQQQGGVSSRSTSPSTSGSSSGFYDNRFVDSRGGGGGGGCLSYHRSATAPAAAIPPSGRD